MCGQQNACPQGTGCFQGGCCQLPPNPCPAQATAVGFCGQQNACPQQTSCYQQTSCCCEQPREPPMPVCQSGQTATRRCNMDQECGANMECSNGGCCPLPYCPTGVQAKCRCGGFSGVQQCPPPCTCMDGLCCPLPTCPSGQTATRTCATNQECGPGFECAGGGCCPLPQCPGGQIATSRCTGATCCCPSGQQCQNGVCCPMPRCPNGQIATSTCTADFQCGVGMECANGACCQLPQCPTGQIATQRCQGGVGGMFGGGSCPSGQICENGVCCPCPVCSNGQMATQLCGNGYGNCPQGFICEGRGCCPDPMPLCPNGARAQQRCQTGQQCPPGYGCTTGGGCCLLSLEPVCPVQQTPVCQCAAPSNACPQQSSCNAGTCCASTTQQPQMPYNIGGTIPGMQCQQNQQCNGFDSGCSQCLDNACACNTDSYSNGYSCQKSNVQIRVQATGACDQFGKPCSVAFNARRRKPVFVAAGNVTGLEPLWYNVVSKRKCPLKAGNGVQDPDSTCLPNEICLNGTCTLKHWPGEYGCKSDAECVARCRHTFCELHNGDKGVGRCMCKRGSLFLGRCFESCPAGSIREGKVCKIEREEDFWKNPVRQEALRKVIGDNMCSSPVYLL